MPRQYLSGSIDVMTDMLLDPEGLVARMKAYTHAFNLEAFIKVSAWARLQGKPACWRVLSKSQFVALLCAVHPARSWPLAYGALFSVHNVHGEPKAA